MTDSTGTGSTIEVYADVVCPFTHVGLHRLFGLRDELQPTVRIQVHAWPLELVNGEPVAGDVLAEEVDALQAQIAPELFQGFDAELFPMSSLEALALATRAYRADARVGEVVSREVRDALFERGRDLGDPDELVEIARRHGLDGPDDTDRQAVLDDLGRGRARGVVGSPHFFVGDRGFFCPTLEIERVDGELRVSFDADGFVDFMRAALVPDDPASRS